MVFKKNEGIPTFLPLVWRPFKQISGSKMTNKTQKIKMGHAIQPACEILDFTKWNNSEYLKQMQDKQLHTYYT